MKEPPRAWAEKQRNGSYRGQLHDADGIKQYAEGTTKTKLAAERLAHAEENKIREGTWIDPKAGTELFSTYFNERWLPSTGSAGSQHRHLTLALQRQHRSAFGHVKVKDIARPGFNSGVGYRSHRKRSPVETPMAAWLKASPAGSTGSPLGSSPR